MKLAEIRYNNFKGCISTSLKMKLEHLKRFLNQGRASVMIGSGFSKNADMDDTVIMKDWNALGLEFYRRLYSKLPEKNEIGLSPIRLASQIDASFGRYELDEMILNSLPDDKIYPGKLHKSLLQLNWKDVFTTNYDTLLERASISSGRHYETVTNKDTLLYKTSPRIIKLHGSFKDIRPFLMTEEDYRTYPQTHPEFINTVRQSLIEGILCLIGFSGNDPNFLEWVGWLRDVMGKHAAPVYLVTCDNNIHDSEIALAKQRGIEYLNLSEIFNGDELDIKEALNFMFKYLKEKEEKDKWTGKIGQQKINTKENLVKLTNEMTEVRKSYPGWVLLPVKYYSNFKELERIFPFYWNDIKDITLDEKEKLNFLFELDWRLTISLTPKSVEWYINAVKEIVKLDFKQDRELHYKQASLNLTLLSQYRQDCDYESFSKKAGEIKQNVILNSRIDLRRRYYYETALFQYSIMNIKEVENILCNWTTSKSDYIGVLWKSCLLAELDRTQEATSLLNESLQDINTKLLVDNNSPSLVSSYCIIESMINIYDFEHRLGYRTNNIERYDFNDIFQEFKNLVATTSNREPITHNHEFNIANISTTWNFVGGGFDTRFVAAYRYLKSYELSGHTMGLLYMGINTDGFKTILPYYASFDFGNAISVLIRTNQSSLVKDTISRDLLKGISPEEINNVFDKLYPNIKSGLESENKVTMVRTGNSIMPLLARLSIKLSDENIIRLLEIYLEYYIKEERYYKKDDLQTIYRSLSFESLKNEINSIYSTPISGKHNNILLPTIYSADIAISEGVVNIITKGLHSDDINVQNSAYYRCTMIYKSLNTEQRNKVDSAIKDWRSKEKLTLNQMYSFNLVSGSDIEDQKLLNVIAEIVEQIKSAEVLFKNSSSPIQSFTSKLEMLLPNINRLNEDQFNALLGKIIECLNRNRESFKKDDSSSFFGGIRHFVNDLLSAVNEIIQRFHNRSSIETTQILNDFKTELSFYKEKGYNVLSLITALSCIEKSQIRELNDNLGINLFSSDLNLQQDAIAAITVLAKNNDCNQDLIKSIILGIRQSQNTSTSNYIELLIDLLLYDVVKKTGFDNIPPMLEVILNSINNFPTTEDYKSDIMYSANKLAGVLSILKCDDENFNTIIDKWREFSNNPCEFNDVRRGFDIGVQIAMRSKTN